MSNRQERKKRAELKRRQYRIKIYEGMTDCLNKGNPLNDALKEGDRYLNKLICINPQEKELILQAAYQIKEKLEKFFKENR